MPKLEALLPKRRAEFDASWSIAVQWGRGHEWGQSNNLLWPFFDEVIRQRYPADASPANGPVKLFRCDPARAWLADPASWKNRAANIASASSYTADKAAACWFPSEDIARVWQPFVVDKPLVQITEPAPQGNNVSHRRRRIVLGAKPHFRGTGCVNRARPVLWGLRPAFGPGGPIPDPAASNPLAGCTPCESMPQPSPP